MLFEKRMLWELILICVLICDINNETVNSQLLSNLNGGIHIFLHRWADKCVFVSNTFSFIFKVTIKIIIE